MNSTSETGHTINVANFESLISFCESNDADYNPSKKSLKIPSLSIMFKQAREKLIAVTNTKNIYDLVINDRQIAFTDLKPTATRIINALDASNAPKQTLNDAKTINRKIQGKRAKAKSSQEDEKRTISVSQQSFNSILDNFAKLVDLTHSESGYEPNEEDLKVDTCQTYIQQLQIINSKVINAYIVYSNAIIDRNNFLYAADTGLVYIASDVKKYIKSVFGATSPQYRQVSKLKFRKGKKTK